jgi:tetratricopeptide (TPR) repeat protein
MDRTNDPDNFLYEDIAFARSVNMSDQAFLQNSHAFLQYCSTSTNDNNDDDDETDLLIDERISYIIDAWAELGYKYFYQNHDAKQALDCYAREKELSLTASKSQSSYFNPLIGSCSERMGDVYVSTNEIEKALTLYKEALDLSMQETFVNNVMTAARCMCKIGRYSPNHEPEIFHRAFLHLIYGYGKPYTRDTIGKCYVNLSRSLQRCEQHQQALKYAKQALSIFLPDPLLLERLIDNCCQLIIELYRSINSDDINMLTKEEILNDRVSLNDEQIKHMLQTTLEELKSGLDNK